MGGGRHGGWIGTLEEGNERGSEGSSEQIGWGPPITHEGKGNALGHRAALPAMGGNARAHAKRMAGPPAGGRHRQC